MDVDCRGCAGCCIDWRALTDAPLDHERRGRYRPLDDAYNLVFLRRDEVRAFLARGLGDALVPRLFAYAPPDDAGDATDDDRTRVSLGGVALTAVRGRPAFCVGLRKPPKPVAPFGRDPAWLPSCVFLDPVTLQCRVHADDAYPADCADYPGQNLALGVETECERVERHQGGERLLDDAPPERLAGLTLGPAALGGKVFAYPGSLDAPPHRPLDADAVAAARGEGLDADWRARLVAAAAASAPGTLDVDTDRFRAAFERARDADSWVGRAVRDWTELAGDADPDPRFGRRVEDAQGAPSTPGWE